MKTTIRRKKRRLVAEHFATIPPAKKMKMVSEMNEIAQKLKEGAGVRCETTR